MKTPGCIGRVSEKIRSGALGRDWAAGDLALPIQRTFLESVNVGDGEEAGESGHTPKNHAAFLDEIGETHRPGIHKDDLDIEDDEEHGDEVEFDTEAGGAFSDGDHAALVRSFLGGIVASFLTEEDTESKGGTGKANGSEGLKDDGKVVVQHGRRIWIR